MRPRTTMLLLLAAIALGATLLLLERVPTRGGEGPQALFAAGTLPIERIDEFELRRGDRGAWRFRREGAAWRQVEPFEHPVDAFSMRQHIAAAEGLRSTRSISPEAMPTDAEGAPIEVGLDPPIATALFRWRDAEGAPHEARVDLGRRGVAGRAWVRLGGDERIHTVGSELHGRLVDGDPRSWRSRGLFDLDESNLDRISMRLGDAAVEMRRRGGAWELLQPVATRLDPEAMRQWLLGLQRAESGAFFEDEPEDLRRYGLGEGADTLRIEGGGEDPSRRWSQTLRIGGPFGPGSSDRFAIVEGRPAVLLIGEGTRASVLRPVVGLIDPTGTAVRPQEIRTIELRGESETIRLQRTLDGFVAQRLDAGGEVESEAPALREAVEALLESLCNARAPEVAVQPFPHEIGVAVAILSGFDGAPLDAVRIAREPQQGRWALENGDSVLRIFPPSLALPIEGVRLGLPPG